MAFTIEGLLRSDIETRYKSYALARNWGFLSTNEIRAKENMNSLGAKGDVYLQPLNMTPSTDIDMLEPRSEEPITTEHSKRLLALALDKVQ